MRLNNTEVLLLPGLDGTGLLFERLVDALDGRVRCRVIGYPASQLLGYSGLATYVADHIGPDPVVVLGESFSGPIAIEVARRVPEKVRALILAGTFTRSPVAPSLLRALSRVSANRLPRILIDRLLMGRLGDAELKERLHGVLAAMDDEVLAHRLREIAAVDVEEAMSRLTCPILALHGVYDWLVPRAPLWTALCTNANAVLRVLPGPHMVLQVNAASAAEEIEDFVAKIERLA